MRGPGAQSRWGSKPPAHKKLKKKCLTFFQTNFFSKKHKFSKSSETHAQNFGPVTIKDMQTPQPSPQKFSNFKNFMKDVECAE